MKNYHGDKIFVELKDKISLGKNLSKVDLMNFILLPLMNNILKDKHNVIEETIELAKQVKDENQQLFIIGGVLTATDKIIDSKYAKTVRGGLK